MTYTGKNKNSSTYGFKLKKDIASYLWSLSNYPWIEAYSPWLEERAIISTSYTLKNKS